MAEIETLVRAVTDEVLRRLQHLVLQAAEPPVPRRILAVITGGTIGLEVGLQELQKLQSASVALTVVLSPAAERVVGAEHIRRCLGEGVDIVDAESPFPDKALQEAEVVVIPVLTMNTAAKLAHTLSDTLASTLIMQALMFGKPVLAAIDAADPQHVWRIDAKMAKSPPALRLALQANLTKIESYGVRLIPVVRLAEEALLLLGGRGKIQLGKELGKRKVIDAAAVKAAAGSGARTISVSKNAVVTPLARDIARDAGLTIIYTD